MAFYRKNKLFQYMLTGIYLFLAVTVNFSHNHPLTYGLCCKINQKTHIEKTEHIKKCKDIYCWSCVFQANSVFNGTNTSTTYNLNFTIKNKINSFLKLKSQYLFNISNKSPPQILLIF